MKLPASVNNWLSITGAILALFNLATILSLVILNTFFGFGGTYIGLFIYMVLPAFMITGLILIPIGMRIENARIKKEHAENEVKGWPVINFNKPSTRNASMIFVFGTIFLLIISSVGSYEAFHFTESVEFCGKLCHNVMEPEFVTYHGSSHERVACVECHVGAGAGWYVKSKMSGLYQVYSVTFHKFPTPIPTPIANLRPARETCEQCHWPEKFYDRKVKNLKSYLADETNTEHDIQLQMKTSSAKTADGVEKGIHQHISADVQIEYKTSVANRQVIPWVKYTNKKTGVSEIYTDSENPISQQKLDSLETRVMDCLDCHNRPSHKYNFPQTFIDKSISTGLIPKTLPGIKELSMKILYKQYSTKDSAFMAIKDKVTEYYKSKYPDIFASRKGEIDQAIAEIQNGFGNNIFPYMKADWRSYPNNIGHLENDGCFRCHNDRHKTESGKVISKDCNLCHSIQAQGNPGNMEYSNSGKPLEFKHPVDVDTAWKTDLCSSCHLQLY